MPFAIEELYVLPLQVDFEFYYIIETNLNTLKHFDLRELDGFCYYPIEVVNKITQIPYCCKVGETYVEYSNFLNQD